MNHNLGDFTFTADEFEANFELIECRECEAEFNIGAQFYYDNLCPSCKKATGWEDPR